MAVTDQTLQNEIQFHLIETPNNGASYGSGLYTPAEVQARLNFRADVFNKLTNISTAVATFNATSGSKVQDFSAIVTTLMDIISVFYTSNNGTTWYNIPRGSSLEGDAFLTDQSAITLPNFYTLDSAQTLTINMFPAPTFSGTNGKITLLYLPNIGGFGPTATGAPPLAIADDFTPFIKHGALADLFLKAGETYDPIRAAICEGIFNLGVEVTKNIISNG